MIIALLIEEVLINIPEDIYRCYVQDSNCWICEILDGLKQSACKRLSNVKNPVTHHIRLKSHNSPASAWTRVNYRHRQTRSHRLMVNTYGKSDANLHIILEIQKLSCLILNSVIIKSQYTRTAVLLESSIISFFSLTLWNIEFYIGFTYCLIVKFQLHHLDFLPIYNAVWSEHRLFWRE